MFENWLGGLIENTDYEIPVILTVVLIPCVWRLAFGDKSRIWRPLKCSIPISALGIIGLIFNIYIFRNKPLYIVAAALLLIPLAVCSVIYARNAAKLRKVKTLSDQDSLTCNLAAAMIQLKNIPTKLLTRRQCASLSRYRMLFLINLGSIQAAKEMLHELKKDKASSLFVQQFIAYKSGDMVAAKDYIKQAEDAIRQSTEPYIIPQIELNQGCSYVTVKNYPVAEEYFKKAAESYKKYKLKDTALLGMIYYNWAFNQTRLLNGEEAKSAVFKLLDAYEARLDLRKHSDALKLFNLKLEMFRQLGISREETDNLVNDVFATLIQKKMPIANKCMFAASVAGVIWRGFFNPEPCLVFLQENIPALDTLRPECRYFAYKELDALFASLRGSMVAQFEKLKTQTAQYMQHFAQKDLARWGDSLPSEAVYARCKCLTEKAGLQRKCAEYDAETVMRYLSSAISLYEENDLHWEASLAHLDYADELCGPGHLNADHQPARKEELQQHLQAVEQFMPQMAEHPALAEMHLRLAFYYVVLDKYAPCMTHYEAYRKTRVVLANFAPWLHRYAMVLAMQVRVLYFCDAIRRLQENNNSQRNAASSAAKQWFVSFPNHDGMTDAVILGKFLGYEEGVLIKIRMWLDEKDLSAPQSHCWLWIREIGLNLDVTFGQFAQEPDNHRLFFLLDRHPFESGEANVIRNSINATHMVFQTGIQGIELEKLPNEEKQLIREVLELIQQELPEACPSIEEIQALLAQMVMPMPATNHG